MEIKDAVQQMNELEARLSAYTYAITVIYFDAQTVAPLCATQARGDCLGLLSEESYKALVNPEVGELLNFLYERRSELDTPIRRRVEILKEEKYDICLRIPIDEFVAFEVLKNEAGAVWHTAKADNDFDSFAPYLEKIIGTQKRFAAYIAPEKDPYDVWLNEYETGLDRAFCDRFFDEIKAGLVPLIKEISARPPVDDSFLFGNFPVPKQRELSDYLMELLLIPRDRCIIGETEHPFTCGENLNDVRITTHYYPDNFASSMYSVIHEGGHALYGLGANPAHVNTCIGSPRSISIHESQSRFFENLIGRSEEFISCIYPELIRLFPEALNSVKPRQLYLAVNKAQPSLIRTEADELTYSLHVLIRYEIEKQLFDGAIPVKELPDVWNRLYKDYLGVDVPDNTRGVLQDSHWSDGAFGYFPSYALGSAYSAQMLNAMQRDIDVFGLVAQGKLEPIIGWLGDKVHFDAGAPLPAEIIEKSCGGAFSPKFYIDYLRNKFSAIYQF